MTEEDEYLFQIPVEGLFHLYPSVGAVTDGYADMILTATNGLPEVDEGRPTAARIDVNNDDDTPATIWFHPDSRLPINPRARDVAATVYGWHMEFRGSVLFLGLPEDKITELVRAG